MRDAVATERRSTPTVVVCTEAVLETVRGAARAYGLPDLPHIAISDSLFGLARDEIAETVASQLDSLAETLLRSRDRP